MGEMSAIANAKIWLETAIVTLDKGIYITALYSAEMAVEIALKGVLLELNIDIPKSHNIVPLLKVSMDENIKLLGNEFIENKEFILETINALLDLRPITGYSFERNMDSHDAEIKANEYVKKAVITVNLCERTIKKINKKSS